MILAITGYIGVGKTTVAKIFQENGFTIIDADSIGHELLKDKSVHDKLVAAFGADILDRTLEIDREKVRKLVFSDEENLKILDSIVHPRLESELKDQVRLQKDDIVIDAALFHELNLKNICDKIILISADLEHVYTRLQKRYTKQEVILIMNSQNMTHSEEIIIENNGTIENLRSEVKKIISEIMDSKYQI
jgi:dephospho-CoA kinase